jgi:hypothetical protein
MLFNALSVLTREALLERGRDCNGWPYVPSCHFLTRPNGFDPAAARLSFSCFKKRAKSNLSSNLALYQDCRHRANRVGFSTHVSITQHSRLILEIPTGESIPAVAFFRSAAERTDSTLKGDNIILREPPAKSHHRAAVVSLIGVIITLSH